MSRKLSDMTLEELWEVFPIILTEHQEAWGRWYDQEKAAIESVLPADRTVRISHVRCTEKALEKRLGKDIAAGLRQPDVIGRSLSYLPLYSRLDTAKIDVSDKNADQVVKEIKEKSDARQKNRRE